jgi:excisionase family DNA binding protein
MYKLLTPHEIADFLGVKLSTIYSWTHTGFIPHIKLGSLLRFREKDVQDWVDRRATRGRTKQRLELSTLKSVDY